MALEIEAKFHVAALDPVRERLRRAGGQRRGRVLEHNRIFDTSEHRLRGKDCGLRLRWRSLLDTKSFGPRESAALLTYKGPRQSGPLKTRAELETHVGDGDLCALILDHLGFHEVVVYETRRESWLLSDCTITLDELPQLGTWVEIEGPDEHAVIDVRDRIQLAPSAMVNETYVEMAVKAGVSDATGCRRLVFDGPTARAEP